MKCVLWSDTRIIGDLFTNVDYEYTFEYELEL